MRTFVVFTALGGMFVAMPLFASEPTPHLYTLPDPAGLPTARLPLLNPAATAPAPGVYLTRPFAGVMLVPKTVDGKVVHQPPAHRTFALKIIEPPLQFVSK